MAENTFVFENQDFNVDKDSNLWKLSLKRSEVGTQQLQQLQLLEIKHPLLMPMTTAVDADTIQFQFESEDHGLSFDTIKSQTLAEQLRFALNVLDLEQALTLPVHFILHPENLFYTKNATAKIAYRSLPEIMVPREFGKDEFLYQYKCFLYALFTDNDFSDLYNGSITVVDAPAFLKTLYQIESLSDMRQALLEDYKAKQEEEEHTLIKVSKIKHKVYKQATIWLGALSAVFVIPLVYLVFIHNPFKEKMLEADTSYIKVDYNQVIDKLENVTLARLPYTQKYELAYSYIHGMSFSDDQRDVILNNVTLKTDELYLDYWINIGRGFHDDAIDAAKRLDDSDLIIYALVQKMDQVRKDNSLSGTDRESQLSELQSQYDKYWKDRKTNLTEEKQKSDSQSTDKSGAESSTAATSSTSSSSSDSK
ncbi:type VII secretion protein EssB [Streptococcus iniae]|uniref:type VII secretion protein EssB n=1 Tax=Streptococcus iniae TaxID=1346 RepID=UPI00274023B1|nr:type VII secretion protein EssB [Streptococcus iniae]WLR88181.1 type VII secretion protein EssB [Streptococcus iniae]WLR90126.1 type VII secretion protein EssB [Streptococcus iniae]